MIAGEVIDRAEVRVSRALVNFALDMVLLLLFVALSIVSVIVQFVFPPGVSAKGWHLWGLNLARYG